MIKKIGFLLVLMFVMFATPVIAQTARDSVISIPASMLTPDQIAHIERMRLESRIQTYGKWVGLGKEIGEAVNGSLAAVTEQTAKFADTDVGRITMFIVVWKVIGKDILRVLFSIALWVFCLPLWIWSFKHNVIKVGHGISDPDVQDSLLLHALTLLIGIGITAFVLFA